MRCPKCQSDMRVTHSYDAGPGGQTQRLECLQCPCVATARTLIVAVQPLYGEGAASLAKRMKAAHNNGEDERHSRRERLSRPAEVGQRVG